MKTIAILFGGCSDEHDVSLQSAHAVISALPAGQYTPLPVGITKEGRWLRYTGDPARIAAGDWHEDTAHCTPVMLSPDRGDRCLIERIPPYAATPIDAVFPVLHGQNGEDGTVQGLCELAGLPLIGCGAAASALCMDKHRAHVIAEHAGVRVPRAVVLRGALPEPALRERTAHLPLPLFVKPVKSGSSLGVTQVAEISTLAPAVALALRYDDEVIVEEAIPGFEVGCAILGTDALTFGAVDEIELQHGFFDFTEKYNLETARIHMPARLDESTVRRICCTAATIYRALGCRVFARVDMFLTPEGGIVFNEVNTIPGFTAHSRYPAMMKGVGLSFPQVLDRLIECGVAQ